MAKSNRSHPGNNQSPDARAQTARDYQVAKDPDIGGVEQRTSHGPHMRDRDFEFREGERGRK